jgi:hypothetical protein
MSKRPTNTVTDTRRSKTVLNKSADVLHHLASVTTIKITSNTPLKYNNESSMEKKNYIHTQNTKEPCPKIQASSASSLPSHIL